MKRQTKWIFYADDKPTVKKKKLVKTPVGYLDENVPVKIKHNTCGRFFMMTPKDHLAGGNCPYCIKGNKKIGGK
jgi:hypothetical protein